MGSKSKDRAELRVTGRDDASEKVALRAVVAATYKDTGNIALTSKRHGVSKDFVRRLGKRHMQGKAGMFQDAPRPGRPRILTKENMDTVYALVKDQSNKLDSARQLHNHMRGEIHCSVETVKRTLVRMGCTYPSPIKRRRLTEKHKLKRHAFAKRFHSVSPWSKCVFTDTTYIAVGMVGKRWVVAGDENVQTYDKYPSKVHVYAGVSCYGRTDVLFVTGTTKQAPYEKKARGVRSKEYQEVVIPAFKTAAQDGTLFSPDRGDDWFFVQDGAKPHTAKGTQALLESEFGTKWIKGWPANSADLNPIENVWAWLKRMVADGNYETIEEFKEAVRKAWWEIPQEHINACCGSVGRRLRLVAQAKGGYIRY
eukprot:1194094-Prorocentrum_minimum.AAC.1